jgi:twitching motility protein PilT
VKSLRDAHIDELLRLQVESGASDLHLTVGLPPMIRVDGELRRTEYEICTEHDTQRLVYDILTDRSIETFEETRELDFSYGVKGLSRFRFNVYRQRGSVGCAIRAIPTHIPTMEEMGLPRIEVLKGLTQQPRGLVLVTGPTGSGKSTTLATMINYINQTRNLHIMTIENPIEFMHRHNRAMINQRELEKDTMTFHNALRAVLREDPDVVLIGEMRDKQTIEATLTVAETGHLAFATLHTNSAPETVDRIIDVFPPEQQDQIRVQLSGCVQGIVCQQLIPRATGSGRVGAFEIMVATPGIRNLIREGKTHQMASLIQSGAAHGMVTLDAALMELVSSGMITRESALEKCQDRELFLGL